MGSQHLPQPSFMSPMQLPSHSHQTLNPILVPPLPYLPASILPSFSSYLQPTKSSLGQRTELLT